MDIVSSVIDTIFVGAAWFIAIAMTVVVLLVKPLRRRWERHNQRRQNAREAEHYRRRLLAATDHAITTAVRAQLAEPVVDLAITIPLRVTVGDVIARARDDFALPVRRRDAAAMLRDRLIFRGHARWPDLLTDAFDDEEDQL